MWQRFDVSDVIAQEGKEMEELLGLILKVHKIIESNVNNVGLYAAYAEYGVLFLQFASGLTLTMDDNRKSI